MKDTVLPESEKNRHDTGRIMPASTEPAVATTPPNPPVVGPIARTERLVLRPLGPHDLPAMHDIFSRDDVQRYIAKQNMSLDERGPWLAARSNPPAFNFALYLRGPDGEPAGPAIGALGSPRHLPMVGYGVHPDCWGKGLVTEALAAFEALFWEWVPSCDGREGGGPPRRGDEGIEPGPMARAAAAGPGFDYMHAFCDVENVGSRRVVEKAGFTLVSLQEEEFDGHTVHVYRFAKPRPGKTLADSGIVVEL